MKRLFSLTLDQQYVSFDKLPYSAAARVDDPDMNLENFLVNMQSPFVAFNLGYEKFPGEVSITYLVRGVKLPHSQDERFAHWSAPHNNENYRQVAQLFIESYGRPIK